MPAPETTSTSASTEGLKGWGDGYGQPSLRTFLLKHRFLGLSALAAILVLAGFTAAGIATSSSAPLSDATTCTRWSSAHQAEQDAYAALYLREHGSLPNGARDTLSVENAIDNSCLQAFSSSDEDRVTLLQAAHGDY